MDKKIVKLLVILAVCVCFIFTSCNNIFESQKSVSKNLDTNSITFRGVLNLSPDVKFPLINNNPERSAKPDLSDSKYVYFATAESADEPPLSAIGEFDEYYSAFTMALAAGHTWTVTCGINDISTNPPTPVFYDSTTKTIDVSSPVFSYVFNIVPTKEATGTIDLHFIIDPETDIETVEAKCSAAEWKLKNNGNEIYELTMSDNKASLHIDDIRSGFYEVSFMFKNEGGTIIYHEVQTINVFDNLTTDIWGYSNDEYTIDADVLEMYVSSSIYVGTTEVCTSPSDSNDGTPYAPLEKLQTAIDLISSSNGEYIDYKIFVGGQGAGTAELRNTLTSQNARSITIQGINGPNTDVLNGGNLSNVIKDNSSVPLTIKNLKISGGKAELGGGIYAGSGSNITLRDGVEVNQNTAVPGNANKTGFGGGLYAADSSTVKIMAGTKFMQNGAQKSDNYIYNNTGSGGAIYADTGSDVKILEPAIFESNHSDRYGGAISLNANTTFYISGGTKIINNSCDSDGGGMYVDIGCEVELLSTVHIEKNHAASGGGIYNYGTITLNDCTFGGTSSSLCNTADNYGGAIFNCGVVNLLGNANIPCNGTQKNNDVYINNYDNAFKSLTVKSSLSNSNVACLTVADWQRGADIVVAGDGVSFSDDILSKFSITDSNYHKVRKNNSIKINAPIYISPTGNNNNPGTLSSPLLDFTNVFTSKVPYGLEAEIIIDGKLVLANSVDIIVSSIESYQPSSINIHGRRGNTYDSIERNLTQQEYRGFVLNIATSVPLKFSDIKITGGKNKNSSSEPSNTPYCSFHGGGICLTGDTDVTLDDGCLITENESIEHGGGIYIGGTISNKVKLTILDGAVISGNDVTGEDAQGGGIYNSGKGYVVMNGGYISGNTSNTVGGGIYNEGKVYISGDAIIGDENHNAPASIANDKHSNYAQTGGSAIYNINGGEVYLGYTYDFEENQIEESTLSKGIYYNYTVNYGGAIYNSGNNSKVTVRSGNIKFNYAGYAGGAIYNTSGLIIDAQVSGTGVNFEKNSAGSLGGAIYTGKTFDLGGKVAFSGSAKKYNDIYLSQGDSVFVNLSSNLIGSNIYVGVTIPDEKKVNCNKVIAEGDSYSGAFWEQAVYFSLTEVDCFNIASDGLLHMDSTNIEIESILGYADSMDYIGDQDDYTFIYEDDYVQGAILHMILKLCDENNDPTQDYVAFELEFVEQGEYKYKYNAFKYVNGGYVQSDVVDEWTPGSASTAIYFDFNVDGFDDVFIDFVSGIGGPMRMTANDYGLSYYIFNDENRN